MPKSDFFFDITNSQKRGLLALFATSCLFYFGFPFFSDKYFSTYQEISKEETSEVIDLQAKLNSMKDSSGLDRKALQLKVNSSEIHQANAHGRKELRVVQPTGSKSSNPYKKLPFKGLVLNARKETFKEKSFFDPNQLDQKAWVGLGFSKKQAEVILKYKTSLGGFSSLKQVEDCFVISKEKFQKLKGYIKFNEVFLTKNQNSKKHKLNSLTKNELYPYVKNSRLAQRIINYREALGGFVSFSQLKEVYGISNEVIKALELLELSVLGIRKLSLNKASVIQLKSHPYLREFCGKIIKHRENSSTFKTIQELKAVCGMDQGLFLRLYPYLTL